MSEGIFETIEKVQSELKNNKEEVATEAVAVHAPLGVDENIIPVLANACAKYMKGLKGNDEYDNFQKGKDLLESGDIVKWFEMNISFDKLFYSDRDKCIVLLCDAKWDPEHGIGISLKNFSVGPQDSFL